MITINGKELRKVTGIDMSVTGNNELLKPHIKITCYHDPRVECNDNEVLDEFNCVRHIPNNKDIGWVSIYLPIETEVHFKTKKTHD